MTSLKGKVTGQGSGWMCVPLAPASCACASYRMSKYRHVVYYFTITMWFLLNININMY